MKSLTSDHDVVSGTFKFSDDTLWKVKEYALNGDVRGDMVGYLVSFVDLAEFDNEVYYTECVPQAATGRTTFGKGWFEELSGRDLGFVATHKIYICLYPAGWHDAQP